MYQVYAYLQISKLLFVLTGSITALSNFKFSLQTNTFAIHFVQLTLLLVERCAVSLNPRQCLQCDKIP